MGEENDEDLGDQRPGIQSVEIAAHILAALAPAGRPIALKELAVRSGFPTGKVHRYLVSLTRAGLVEQDESTGHYGVGRSAISIGLSGLWASSPTREAARAIENLRDQTGETAFAAIWTDAGPVVSMLEQSERPIYMNIRVGALLPLTASAAGRVYCAFLPASPLSRAKRMQEQALGSQQQPSSQQLQQILGQVRDQGYAAITGLTIGGVNAIAAPIRDYRGAVTVVIGLLGRENELQAGADSQHVRALLHEAKSASERLGYSRQPRP